MSKPEFQQFLADYFVECDEHLDVSRRSLLALESSIGRQEPDRQLLDELFRSFHSIKGLSAMVGVADAETVAHQLESYLGELRKRKQQVTAAGVETLIAGVKLLDQIITARRTGGAPPDSAPMRRRLELLIQEDPKPGSTQPPASTRQTGAVNQALEREVAARLKPGETVWQFTFTPSAELSKRGVNVNSVRERLQKIGEILQALPVIRPGGQISFSFLVATAAPRTDFADWEQDGLTISPAPLPVQEDNQQTVPAAEAAIGQSRPAPAANVVRVDLGRLDDLMQKVGELVLSRARLEESVRRLRVSTPPAEWRTLQETNQAMERQLRDLRDGVMRIRMIPFREVFARMQFVIRDLAGEFHKQVHLQLSGEETEIDKFVVERMMDPLLHLVRNAVCHGLEAPDERAAAGKSPEGHISLRARTSGETVTLEVEDDGRGIDAAQVFARARATGQLAAGTPEDPAALLDVLCTPGFSIRDQADRASGRGVGMDVVRQAVEDLNGSLALHTIVGKETRFVIELPLTLSIADALIVQVDGQKYAIPQAAVREVLQVATGSVHALEHNEIISYREGVLPLLRMSVFFGGEGLHKGDFNVLVLGEGKQAVGLTVDRILGLREIVVRPVTDTLIQVDGISGATELGDGRVVLILDAAGLTRASRKSDRGRRPVVLARPHAASIAIETARKGA